MKKQAPKPAINVKSPEAGEADFIQAIIRQRESLKLNQHDYWRVVNVQPSRASLYESGSRAVPTVVRNLINLVHGDPTTREMPQQMGHEEAQVIRYLRQEPDLFALLLAQANDCTPN